MFRVGSEGGGPEFGRWRPLAEGASAVFGNLITANRTVTLSSAVTVGSLTIQDTGFTYTITGSPALTLDNSTGDGIARVTVSATATTHQHLSPPLSAAGAVLV